MTDYGYIFGDIAEALYQASKHPEKGVFTLEFTTKGILIIDWTFADIRTSICTANLLEETSWAALLGGNIKIPTWNALDDALTAIHRILDNGEVETDDRKPVPDL
jgi:hypothetical protein